MGNLLEKMVMKFRETIAPYHVEKEPVSVVARPLTSEEAIGHPEHDDYPLLKGKERMMASRFRGAEGQAYSDHTGDFSGTLEDVLTLPMDSNFHRAVLVATVNAVLRQMGIIDKSQHCKDKDPVVCAGYLADVLAPFAPKKIGMIGHQPRLLEAASGICEVRLCDRDPDQVSTEKSGILVEPPEAGEEIIAWCDLILSTGTTLVNDTIDAFAFTDKPAVFYGITIAGAAKLLDLNTFCPLGR